MSHKTIAWMDFLLIQSVFLKHSDLNYFDIEYTAVTGR